MADDKPATRSAEPSAAEKADVAAKAQARGDAPPASRPAATAVAERPTEADARKAEREARKAEKERIAQQDERADAARTAAEARATQERILSTGNLGVEYLPDEELEKFERGEHMPTNPRPQDLASEPPEQTDDE